MYLIPRSFGGWSRLCLSRYSVFLLIGAELRIYKIKENEFEIYKPQGLEIPLVGRYYIAGVFDCFTLVQDYFQIKFNILISDFNHELRYLSSEEEVAEREYPKELQHLD